MDLGSILQRISAYKNAFLEPGHAPETDDPYDHAAATLYPAYQEQLEAYAAVDFDDLICKPCAMLEGTAACRKRWAQRFRYVLVDEYQDSNAAQLRLLRAIAGQHQNLCVVGDDDQSIYGWRGAEVKNILRFDKDFPGARVVNLERNYRSTPSILELANLVIAENKDRHDKRLVPVRSPGPPVNLVVTADGDAEATWVAAHIRQVLKERRFKAGEVAVLYRSSILSRDLETALRAEGVAYRVLGGTAFYDSKEVKDLLAYLRVLSNPADELSLRRVINSPPRGIGVKTLAALTRWAEEGDVSFIKALRSAREVLGQSSRPAAAVMQFLDLIDRYRRRLGRGLLSAEGVRALVDELCLLDSVQGGETKTKGGDRRLAHLLALIEGVDAYCRRVPRPTLADYCNRMSLVSADDNLDGSAGDRVTLSTLHGTKGLEFRLVVLVGMEEGFLPHDRTINPHQNDLVGGEISEERRLCYVGITRAMDSLVLTRCKERLVRGKLQPRTPSRFMDKVPEGMLVLDDQCRQPEPDEVKGFLDAIFAKLSE